MKVLDKKEIELDLKKKKLLFGKEVMETKKVKFPELAK